MNLSEILVILIVALIVIKPERLPEISYTLGRILAKSRKLYQEILNKANLPL